MTTYALAPSAGVGGTYRTEPSATLMLDTAVVVALVVTVVDMSRAPQWFLGLCSFIIGQIRDFCSQSGCGGVFPVSFSHAESCCSSAFMISKTCPGGTRTLATIRASTSM